MFCWIIFLDYHLIRMKTARQIAGQTRDTWHVNMKEMFGIDHGIVGQTRETLIACHVIMKIMFGMNRGIKMNQTPFIQNTHVKPVTSRTRPHEKRLTWRLRSPSGPGVCRITILTTNIMLFIKLKIVWKNKMYCLNQYEISRDSISKTCEVWKGNFMSQERRRKKLTRQPNSARDSIITVTADIAKTVKWWRKPATLLPCYLLVNILCLNLVGAT